MSDEQIAPWKGIVDDERGTVVLEGEVDFSNSLDVRDWLKERCAQSDGDLLLDLLGLNYIDSSGLAVLIEIRKLLKPTGRAVRIVKVSQQVSKLFALTQIGGLFGM